MKFAIALIAGVAILASVHAAPAAEDEVYISESLKDIIAAIRGRIQGRIDELQKRREELREQIKNATGEAKEQLRKSLEKISGEIQVQLKELLEVIKRAVRKNDESYFKDAIVGKIRELREKATEILKRVSEIVKEEAANLGERAKTRFLEEKQRLIDQAQQVNDRIKEVVNDVINGKQEESYELAAETYFIDGSAIRARIAELGQKARELGQKARAAAGAKKDELLEQLNEVKGELVGAAKDLRNALREIVGKEPITYSVANDLDEVYFVETVKGLRRKLNEKLEQVKGYVEMIKIAHGVLKDQLKAGLETAKGELRDLKERIIEKVKDELNKQTDE